MTTKWGQRWTGATFGPWGTKFGGALSGRKKEKKRKGLSQEAPRESKRSLKVCTSVLFSFFFSFLFFYNERFKTWRLLDCHSVICKAREKVGNRGWVQKAPVWEPAGSYQGLLNQKLLTSWEVFTPLRWHAEFATHFYIKLIFTKCSRSQWSWILTCLPLKWCALSPHAAVGDCSKTRCVYKVLPFCPQTKHA